MARSSMLVAACTALLVAAWTSQASAACAPHCTCLGVLMLCNGGGLTEFPSGEWPSVAFLDVSKNAISSIPSDLGKRFPALLVLRMREGSLQRLDLDALVGPGAPPRLMSADLSENAISQILPPSSGIQTNALYALLLNSNRIATVDRDVFRGLHNLQHLTFGDNPLVVPRGQPLLAHSMLRTLDLTRVDASGLSEHTFALLPSLKTLGLEGSGVKSIHGVFTHLASLEALRLESNAITEITVGSFSSGRPLRHLSLDRNPLVHVDTAELPVKDGGELAIEDTPLVCACAHVEVARWAATHGVELFASCNGSSSCSFVREA